ncbi:MAG: toxin-antitoxin system YwqK family antitoxin [Alphaproteobacteria bacterium]|nr:toxin-antitoxin system YwqK family antitoxin [Alphaproteobacteria bacterium]
MKKISIIAISVSLTACMADKADYIMNQTAFCTGIGEPGGVISCQDKDKQPTNGTVVEYWENGNKHRYFSTTNGLSEGEWIKFDEQGRKVSVSMMSKGKQHGVARVYTQNGNISYEKTYKDGKLDGIAKVYHENGKTKRESMFKDNKQDGIDKHYYENGKLRAEGWYKDGKPDGIEKQYYENGQLERTITWKNGIKEGAVKNYYENGNLKSEGNNKNDQLDGVIKLYDTEGHLIEEMTFKQGKQINTQKSSTGPKSSDTIEQSMKQCLTKANVCWWTTKGCRISLEGTVYDITKKGVVLEKKGRCETTIENRVADTKCSDNTYVFLYTDKQYANGDTVDNNYYYENVGTYEYKTTSGGTKRLHAYKETNIPQCRYSDFM